MRDEDVVEILEAYDLLGSYRAAAEAVGCDHHTVRRYVQLRAAGNPPGERAKRSKPIDEFLPKIEELVERSNGRVRADVVHERLLAMGFEGGERTTRRMVAAVRTPTGPGIGGCSGRGCPSRDCGCSGTGGTGRGSAA